MTFPRLILTNFHYLSLNYYFIAFTYFITDIFNLTLHSAAQSLRCRLHQNIMFCSLKFHYLTLYVVKVLFLAFFAFPLNNFHSLL